MKFHSPIHAVQHTTCMQICNMNSLEIQIMRPVLTYTTQSIFQYQRAMLLFLGPNMQVEQNMPFEIRFFLARSFYFIKFDPPTLFGRSRGRTVARKRSLCANSFAFSANAATVLILSVVCAAAVNCASKLVSKYLLEIGHFLCFNSQSF